jgi:uncharacterized protein involved in copper resistance
MQLQFLTRFARAAIITIAVIFGTLLAANGTASAACDTQAGKELYHCLANKLDHVASMSSRSPETQAALQKAASQLRVATNKAQALSAISQARSVVAGVIQRVRSAGQDSSGLARVSGILANAARLIQLKG